MSFCLNCSSHRPCDCAGPPPEVVQHEDGSVGVYSVNGATWRLGPEFVKACQDPNSKPPVFRPADDQQPKVPKDLRHPATKWFDQQVEEVLIPDGHIDPSGYPIGIDGEFFKHLMTKAFNAGACHACREILDVLPDFDNCEPDDLRYAAEDAYGICKSWLD